MITEKKEVLLDVKDLTVQFGSKRHPFTAVDHVNFQTPGTCRLHLPRQTL